MGLMLCWGKGLHRVILEVDSQSVVDIIQRKERTINVLYRLVRDINNLLERNWEVLVAHTYREGNRCFDAMTNHALSLPQGLHILDSPPESVSHIMMEDIIGVSFLRSCIV